MLRHSSRDKVCEHCAFMLYILYLGIVSCCVDGGLVGFFHGSGPGSLRLWFHCIVQELLVLKGWSQEQGNAPVSSHMKHVSLT